MRQHHQTVKKINPTLAAVTCLLAGAVGAGASTQHHGASASASSAYVDHIAATRAADNSPGVARRDEAVTRSGNRGQVGSRPGTDAVDLVGNLFAAFGPVDFGTVTPAGVAARIAVLRADVRYQRQVARQEARQRARRIAERVAAREEARRAAEDAAARQAEQEAAQQVAAEQQTAPATGGVIGVASSLAGVPYVYGGTTPAGFDCSGYTSYVFARLGKYLPRTSGAQAAATARISAAEAVPGDLVFFTGSGGVYHVGIYAGGGSIWHSPRPGSAVQLAPIWTSSVFYGRVR